NDTNVSYNPGGYDVPYDGADTNCDGLSDYDADRDGYDSTQFGGTDCNDYSPGIRPGANEIYYDGTDQNCDGGSDYDADRDGYDSDQYSGSDCDDTNAAVYPGGVETLYDGIDGDCDGGSDWDGDGDGFDGIAGGGDDCNDANAAIFPYAFEKTNDGIDNDCDGGADGADPSTFVSYGTYDDTSIAVTFPTGFTFPFCGSNRTSMYMGSNGMVSVNAFSTYTESQATMRSTAMINGFWDDLYPQSGQWGYVAESDHVSFYWNAVPECCSSGNGANTFSITLLPDGRMYIYYGAMSAVDALVGVSCGTNAANGASDISALALAQPGSAEGIGGGVNSILWEQFYSGFDLSAYQYYICPPGGTDNDADGWSAACGDSDDYDPSVYPQ
ncbi:MAG TPA: putative metal-binding motif-containing protein, partial [Myxococcota bacterium]|nr:putative metal-binding motif-containing protein [Myxococcota bacterium]